METGKQLSEIASSPMVSIIVPAYNIEEYLSACLESILNQTYTNIEIVVVDDGSSDQTGAIADQYSVQYPNKLLCIHTTNQGVSRARLTGIKTSHGEWIGFVDGDDAIEADMYQRLIENALSANAELSHCGYQTIVEKENRIHWFYNTGKTVIQNNAAGLRDLLEGRFVEPGLCNKMYRKKLFDGIIQHEEMFYGIKYTEDLLMNYYLFKQSRVSVYEDFCPYHYMARGSSATRKAEFQPARVLDPVRVRRIILDDVDDSLKELAWNRYLICCMNAYASLSAQSGYDEERTNLRQTLLSNKDKWHTFRHVDQVKLRMLLASPALYRALYCVYERLFQKKTYE